MAYETLHWDGNVLLFTTNGAGKLDDVKIGAIGDITPLDTGYAGLTFWDRDPSGSFVYCHNATGAAGSGIPHVKTVYGVKTGNAIHSNPCYVYSGQTIGAAPNSIVWWSDGQSSQRIGWDGVLGMPRTDGFNTIQGVRAFDASMGQWTAPDAYSGVVDDPMTQKSYVWNGNNPVAYSDPSGYYYEPAYDSLNSGVSFLQQQAEAAESPDDGQTVSGQDNSAGDPLPSNASGLRSPWQKTTLTNDNGDPWYYNPDTRQWVRYEYDPKNGWHWHVVPNQDTPKGPRPNGKSRAGKIHYRPGDRPPGFENPGGSNNNMVMRVLRSIWNWFIKAPPPPPIPIIPASGGAPVPIPAIPR